METRLPQEKSIQKEKSQRSLVTGIAVGAFVIGALLFAGMQIERARYQKPLPANQSCFQAVKDQKALLQSQINELFGTPKPDGVPTVEQVAQLIKDCEVSRDMTQVAVK